MSDNLWKDPYNIVITGVGGQGNVMASRLLGNMLVGKGYYVTIGETFGASQRGGSVMSHMRISGKSIWSPQIPEYKADLIIAIEPVEGIRVLARYGNLAVKLLCNSHPVYPSSVIRGEVDYPSPEEIETSVRDLAPDTTFMDATEKAVSLGNPILAGIVLLGTACGTGVLPLDRKDFHETIVSRLENQQVELNMKAFDMGFRLLKN
ncbi:MAG: indolepyruvate oxidoreductase subunit beta [Thermodesulfobacteriota bacterium]|nr:indolepyruvate oxidoreductase subunit beta [Thermodesulfobacteriota bacterium]